ncbi:hypothetical protein D5086_032366 [Populus alba]|uniref:Uncharacterized protein n=1 Tax=Populus alba TaxID=43335 RepID=A0ACC4AL91_POPAL
MAGSAMLSRRIAIILILQALRHASLVTRRRQGQVRLLPPTRDFNWVKYQYEVRYDSHLCDKNLEGLSAEDVFLRQMIVIERPHNKE